MRTWDKPGFSPYSIQWKPDFTVFVPGTKGGTESLCEKSLCAFFARYLGGCHRHVSRCKRQLSLGQTAVSFLLEVFQVRLVQQSEKLEKAAAVDLEKHPARKVGTRSRAVRTQCVCGRFAFPGARKFQNLKLFAIREVHAQYDWTTGVPDNGNEWRKFPALYLARTLRIPLFCTLFNKGGNRKAFRLPGERGGDHFHCTVEPSPGHIRCREKFFSYFPGCFPEPSSKTPTKTPETVTALRAYWPPFA